MQWLGFIQILLSAVLAISGDVEQAQYSAICACFFVLVSINNRMQREEK
jgi:hypothetical protein